MTNRMEKACEGGTLAGSEDSQSPLRKAPGVLPQFQRLRHPRARRNGSPGSTHIASLSASAVQESSRATSGAHLGLGRGTGGYARSSLHHRRISAQPSGLVS